MAAKDLWKADPYHTQFRFSVAHLGVSKVRGHFNEGRVEVRSATENFADAEVEVVINVASIDTDNPRRDAHLRSKDFFDAKNHPEMIFRSTGIRYRDGSHTFRLEGNLTIRDKTLPIVLEGEYNGKEKGPFGLTHAGFELSTHINRFDFGLSWNKLDEKGVSMVGKEVQIEIELELLPAAEQEGLIKQMEG